MIQAVYAMTVILTLTIGAVGSGITLVIVRLLRGMRSGGIYRDMLVISPTIVTPAMVFCVVLGVVGGLYPAWRASMFRPVEALRYE